MQKGGNISAKDLEISAVNQCDSQRHKYVFTESGFK